MSGSAQSFTNSYSYNPAGNLTGFTQNRGGSTTSITYSFDHDANRLTSSTTGASTTSTTWTYRADDAIKTAQTSGQPLATFGYSAAGELTDDGCFTYSCDEFSRTATSTLDSGAAASCGRAGTTTYSYDGLDRQQQAVITGSSRNGTVHNSYDGLSTTLVGQTGALTGSGVSAPNVLYALNPDGAAVAYTQTGSSSSTFHPILGTTPPANGNGVCASGSAAATTGNSIWYRWQARAFTTGSYQLGARTYQPNLGTFTTPDTYRVDTPDTDLSVGTDPLTENSYSYVNGNPVNFTDPNGHVQCRMLPVADRYGCEGRGSLGKTPPKPSPVTPIQQQPNDNVCLAQAAYEGTDPAACYGGTTGRAAAALNGGLPGHINPRHLSRLTPTQRRTLAVDLYENYDVYLCWATSQCSGVGAADYRIGRDHPDYFLAAVKFAYAGYQILGNAAMLSSALDPGMLTAEPDLIAQETGTVGVNGRAAAEGAWFQVTKAGVNRAGTLVPESFDLSVAGERFSVVPNATKHMAEYATSTGAGSMPISSLASAVETAVKQGLAPGRNLIQIDSWELGIDTTDNVIYHAVYRP